MRVDITCPTNNNASADIKLRQAHCLSLREQHFCRCAVPQMRKNFLGKQTDLFAIWNGTESVKYHLGSDPTDIPAWLWVPFLPTDMYGFIRQFNPNVSRSENQKIPPGNNALRHKLFCSNYCIMWLCFTMTNPGSVARHWGSSAGRYTLTSFWWLRSS